MTSILKQKNSLWTTRFAVLSYFFMMGAAFANYSVRIPEIRDKLGLTEATIGLASLSVSLSVIGSLLIAGYLIERFGSRFVTRYGAVLMVLSILVVGFAGSFGVLVGILLFAGSGMSLTDMAMNSQAIEVERRWGKTIMPSFHAGFSVGGFAGALLGGAFAALDISLEVNFAILGIIFTLIALYAGQFLLHVDGEGEDKGASVFQLPQRALWGLGAVVFASGIGEGSMETWSALYMTDIVGVGESFATLGFAAFALMMTIGRVSGDYLATRFNPAMLVRGGGLLGAIGFTIALMFPTPYTVIFGFALVGIGLSIVVPLAFSAGGNMPNIPSGTGLAGVASIGYAAFLAGPPIVGFIAEATSLRAGMIFITVMVFTLVFSGRSLRKSTIA